MRHRFPKSIHSQIEAIFHSVRVMRSTKEENLLGIRSFGTWRVYRNVLHRFGRYMKGRGCVNILDSKEFFECTSEYLESRLSELQEQKGSRQTMEIILSAFGKFSYATNCYIKRHGLDISPVDIESLRERYYSKSKLGLPASSRSFEIRSYPDPVGLIEAIDDQIHQLQASLQYEGGLRASGVGAPGDPRLKNPLTRKGLRGISRDPVTHEPVGVVAAVEKGGKETEHYVSVVTYRRLEEQIANHGSLESDYTEYVSSINRAAKDTGQYEAGRGSHGLKHNFAEERYLQCVDNGMSHEQALQQTSLEMSHFRFRETLTYTRGKVNG
ncbi:MAG: hypothetical protein C0622_03235 [Desulfuromonas sp.]|nr:MAG: hypothetical protein C0622_03235 [Desulfuromonas sp.]